MSSGFMRDFLEGPDYWETLAKECDDPVKDEATGKKTDNNKPKRPLSAYNFFFQNERQSLLQDTPTRKEGKPRRSHGKIGFADLARKVAAKWRILSEEDRSVFEEKAAVDKERYRLEMGNWRVGKPSETQVKASYVFEMTNSAFESISSIGVESNSLRNNLKIGRTFEEAYNEPLLGAFNGNFLPETTESKNPVNDINPMAAAFTKHYDVTSPDGMAQLASQLGCESTEYLVTLFRR